MLILLFGVLPIVKIKDHFGFEFDAPYFKRGKIQIVNPVVNSHPTKGEVFDGYVLQGEAKYELIPLNTSYKAPCLLFLQQESGNHFIYGDEIKFDVYI